MSKRAHLVVLAPVISAAVPVAVLTTSAIEAQYSKFSTVDLVQTQFTVPRKSTPGKRFVVLDTVDNAGETASPMTVTGFCLAKDDTCGETDLRFAARRVPALVGAQHAAPVPPIIP